jgi:hypothetical protein
MQPIIYDDIPLPTPTPYPTYTIPDGMEMQTDWIEGIGYDWASEAIQWWQMIPLDFRTGVQAAILFSIFIGAFLLFFKKVRGDKEADA